MILKPNQRSQIMPLPVVLISTLSGSGVRNAAPWSCVTPVLRPLDEVLIASWLKRDTLENIRQTREFVINIPRAGMEEAVMVCARNYPPEVDEFQEAGLAARPSVAVKPPGIEGCLAWAECRLEEEIARERYVLIVGRVVHLEADDRFFSAEDGMDYEKAMPLCAVGGPNGMQFVRPVSTGKGDRYASTPGSPR
ncbi:MAG TPA: flavin reductase family protein [Methanothrix sp.]|mgnify:FL=1|nr:flavin reductase family protein [Methanothrix sp.]HPT20257.1 flavin reductase family protein [Methanothrix sp.]